MATRKEFVDGIIEDWKAHSVYIGTGNGELLESLTIKDIHKMEQTCARRDSKGNPLWDSDTKRDFAFIGKCYGEGLDMSAAKAADCSGLEVGVLRRIGTIKPTSDYNCRTFQQACTEVALKDLQEGDLVFNKKLPSDGKSIASHMGTYVGDGYVIESRGRDYGVVKRKTSEGGWAIGGRLPWFSDDIPVLTRNLKYVKDNLMRGKDVKECQEQLKKKGYNPGAIDGIFGVNTLDAVIEFQTEFALEVDGVVGPNTWTKLFTS